MGNNEYNLKQSSRPCELPFAFPDAEARDCRPENPILRHCPSPFLHVFGTFLGFRSDDLICVAFVHFVLLYGTLL